VIEARIIRAARWPPVLFNFLGNVIRQEIGMLDEIKRGKYSAVRDEKQVGGRAAIGRKADQNLIMLMIGFCLFPLNGPRWVAE